MFGSICCSHCGRRVKIDKFTLVEKSVLCEECVYIEGGNKCCDCFRYNLSTGVCTADELEHKADSFCNIIGLRVIHI